MTSRVNMIFSCDFFPTSKFSPIVNQVFQKLSTNICTWYEEGTYPTVSCRQWWLYPITKSAIPPRTTTLPQLSCPRSFLGLSLSLPSSIPPHIDLCMHHDTDTTIVKMVTMYTISKNFLLSPSLVIRTLTLVVPTLSRKWQLLKEIYLFTASVPHY